MSHNYIVPRNTAVLYTNMHNAGVVTDGEWNTLISNGCTRPLSIFEIRSDVRNKYSRTSIGTLTNMLTPKGMQGLTCNNNVGCNVVCIIIHTSVSSSGEVTALHRNSPVSETTLREIAVYIWMEEGCTMKDVVARLRPKTVPPGYSTTEWKEGLFL